MVEERGQVECQVKIYAPSPQRHKSRHTEHIAANVPLQSAGTRGPPCQRQKNPSGARKRHLHTGPTRTLPPNPPRVRVKFELRFTSKTLTTANYLSEFKFKLAISGWAFGRIEAPRCPHLNRRFGMTNKKINEVTTGRRSLSPFPVTWPSMGHLPGYRTEAKANWLRGDLPCAMGPLPATDRLEAKQLRECLLSKRVEVLREKSK